MNTPSLSTHSHLPLCGRVLAGISTVLVLGVTNVRAEDWPEFRGPARDGHSTAVNLPTIWDQQRNITWKAELPGRAWSSPIVAGDRIYLTNAVGSRNSADLKDKYSLRVLAVNAADGKVIWDEEVFSLDAPFSQGVHQKNSYASPTPVFQDGRIYAHFGHFGTVCMDAEGKIIWKSQKLSYRPVHGNGGCPVIVGNALIFAADAQSDPFVAALDINNGNVLWQTKRGVEAKKSFSFCTPLVVEVNGVKQVISPGSNVVMALDPATGKDIWRVRYDGYSVVPRPVFAHGMVFLSTGYDRATAMAIRADGKGDVTDTHVAWTMTKGAPLTPSMLVIGDELYMVADNGMVSCVDAKSGELHWQERVSRATSSSPLYADGKIYIQDEQGVGYVLKPGKQLTVLSRNDLDDKSLASYAVAGSNLLIRTEHALWCVGNKN